MATTSEQMRAWQGPAIFSYGFRPFFLGGAIWVAFSMVAWIAMLNSTMSFPTAFDPTSWHAHAFLFGYLGAVITGFMMTAVPNWTGRLPIVGWSLAGLFGVWIAGRVVVMFSAYLPPVLVAAIDLGFGVMLALVMTREIVAGKNWRNLMVIGVFLVFVTANGIFHFEAARGDYAAGGIGLRLGVAAALMLIALIGGRIVPSFTRNWLVKRDATRLPVPPMQRFDRAALLVLAVSLALWVSIPEGGVTALALILAGVMHALRLWRWCGLATRTEPLVWVLHIAYAFIPLGALAEALTILQPGLIGDVSAQHIWMTGAIGLMTLAVMSRATLGHTGYPLVAGPVTLALYLSLIAATLLRVLAGVLPIYASTFHGLSALAWIIAFGGFAVIYGPKLLTRRKET